MFACEDRDPGEGVLLNDENMCTMSHTGIKCMACYRAYHDQFHAKTQATEGMYVELWELLECEHTRARVSFSSSGKLNWAKISKELVGQGEREGGIESWRSIYGTQHQRIRILRLNLVKKFQTPSSMTKIPACPEKCDLCGNGNCTFAGNPITNLETCNQFHKHGGRFTNYGNKNAAKQNRN